MVSNGKTAVCLHLPPTFALDQILGDTRQQNPQRSVYAVGSASQAIRQALSLARVLAYPLVSQDTWFSCTSSLSQNGPLLMDSWLDLRHLQKRWDASAKSSPVALMEMALNVAKCSAVNTDLPPSLKSKANALLVLLCSEMISCPGVLVEPDPTGEQSRVTFCKALLAISDASLQSYAIGRLASSKLVQELALLSTQYPPIGEDTDVWVRPLSLEVSFDCSR